MHRQVTIEGYQTSHLLELLDHHFLLAFDVVEILLPRGRVFKGKGVRVSSTLSTVSKRSSESHADDT